MPFVKIDTDILRSTVWFNRAQRDVFLTALFMAELHELRAPTPQLMVETLQPTGWTVPPGWYGFVQAAGVGIAWVAQVTWEEALPALKAMGEPEPESRSQEFEGRRLVRVDGGYIVLNYMKYRDRDYTAAERQMRYRARKRAQAAGVAQGNADVMQGNGVSPLLSHNEVTPNDTGDVIVTDSRVQSTEYRVRTLPNGRESARIPPAALMRLWNELTQPPIPRCVALSKTRTVHATARLKEHPLDYWQGIIERIQESDFCRGVNDRAWVATFDWLVSSPDTAIKVAEGKYDNRASVAPRTAGPTAKELADDVRRQLAAKKV